MRILNFAHLLPAGGRGASGMMKNVFPLAGFVFLSPVLSLIQPSPAPAGFPVLITRKGTENKDTDSSYQVIPSRI